MDNVLCSCPGNVPVIPGMRPQVTGFKAELPLEQVTQVFASQTLGAAQALIVGRHREAFNIVHNTRSYKKS